MSGSNLWPHCTPWKATAFIEGALNEEDEITFVRRLRSTHTSLEIVGIGPITANGYRRKRDRPIGEDASQCVRASLMGELSETTRSHRARNRIRRGVVW
jgi:hypothetical protein